MAVGGAILFFNDRYIDRALAKGEVTKETNVSGLSGSEWYTTGYFQANSASLKRTPKMHRDVQET